MRITSVNGLINKFNKFKNELSYQTNANQDADAELINRLRDHTAQIEEIFVELKIQADSAGAKLQRALRPYQNRFDGFIVEANEKHLNLFIPKTHFGFTEDSVKEKNYWNELHRYKPNSFYQIETFNDQLRDHRISLTLISVNNRSWMEPQPLNFTFSFPKSWNRDEVLAEKLPLFLEVLEPYLQNLRQIFQNPNLNV